MANVDFSDRESAARWFGGQSAETRCVITSRATLRVLSNISLVDAVSFERVALISFRAVLTCAARGLGIGETVIPLDAAAAHFADSIPHSSLVPSVQGTPIVPSAANNAVFAAVSTARANYSARDAANSVDAALTSAIHINGFAATPITAEVNSDRADLNTTASDLFQRPVWADKTASDAIADNRSRFLTYLDSDKDWSFWRRWYLEMWEGRFTDWDLAIEVAKIPDEVWDAGLSAVAEAIREIEARFRTNVSVPLVRNAADTAFELADEA